MLYIFCVGRPFLFCRIKIPAPKAYTAEGYGENFQKCLEGCLSNYNLAATNYIDASREIEFGLRRIHVAKNQAARSIVNIYAIRVEARCDDTCCGAFNI